MNQTLCIVGGITFGLIFGLIIHWMERESRHD